MFVQRILNGFILGLLGYLVINDSQKIKKLNDIERFLWNISSDIKDIKDVNVEQKEFNDFLERINSDTKVVEDISFRDFSEEVNEETGEKNPNLIYDDDNINNINNIDTEEKSSDSSSDGWKEVKSDNENNCEEKNDGSDEEEVEKTTKIE